MAAHSLTPELALRFLGELSTDIKASVLLDSAGSPAAASEDGEAGRKLGELTAELFAAADAADGDGVTQVEVSTGDGAVYAVREEHWSVAVVTGRFALPSLMFYDLRTVLGDLEGSTG
jgi:predicted regulator of Ras-like GTPase activity (Roadblock/LC7/MglB family)